MEKGHNHDNDLELRAYSSPGNPIANDWECQASETDELRLLSQGDGWPAQCTMGGGMGLMVTVVTA